MSGQNWAFDLFPLRTNPQDVLLRGYVFCILCGMVSQVQPQRRQRGLGKKPKFITLSGPRVGGTAHLAGSRGQDTSVVQRRRQG